VPFTLAAIVLQVADRGRSDEPADDLRPATRRGHLGADLLPQHGRRDRGQLDEDPPEQRTGDEDPAVRGKDPAEVRIGLQGRDEAVRAEREHTGAGEDQAAVLTDALPDEPRAADLG